MKRYFLTAFIAVALCAIGCTPQPEMPTPEEEQEEVVVGGEDDNVADKGNENEGSEDNSEGDENAENTSSSNNGENNENGEAPDNSDNSENTGGNIEPDGPIGPTPGGAMPTAPYIQRWCDNVRAVTGWGVIDAFKSRKNPENALITILYLFSWPDGLENQQPLRDAQTAWDEEHCEVLTSIQNEMTKHTKDGSIHWAPYYESQYIDVRLTNIEITSDQTLWGLEPGTNLIDKFRLYSAFPPQMFSYPDGKYMGNIGEYFHDSYTYDGGYKVDWRDVLHKCYAPNTLSFAIKELFDERPNWVKYVVKMTFNDEIVVEFPSTWEYIYK